MLDVIKTVCTVVRNVCLFIIVLYCVLYVFCVVSDWFDGRKKEE